MLPIKLPIKYPSSIPLLSCVPSICPCSYRLSGLFLCPFYLCAHALIVLILCRQSITIHCPDFLLTFSDILWGVSALYDCSYSFRNGSISVFLGHCRSKSFSQDSNNIKFYILTVLRESIEDKSLLYQHSQGIIGQNMGTLLRRKCGESIRQSIEPE